MAYDLSIAPDQRVVPMQCRGWAKAVQGRLAQCIVALLVLVAASPALSACDDLRGLPINAGVDWETEVKPLLNSALGGRCTSCHFGDRYPDMSDEHGDAIYALVNSYAIPGRPEVSGLLDKINCDPPAHGSRMPLGSNPMSIEEQGIIYDWIKQGARGEDPNFPISRSFIFSDGTETLRWY